MKSSSETKRSWAIAVVPLSSNVLHFLKIFEHTPKARVTGKIYDCEKLLIFLAQGNGSIFAVSEAYTSAI